MRIFYDTNVILDLLADRPGFADTSARAVSIADTAGNRGFMSALSVCDIVYIMRKCMAPNVIGMRLQALADILHIVDVTGTHVMSAFGCGMPDYEDAVQANCAVAAAADVIVTRDPVGFAGAKIRVMSPVEFLESLKSV